MTQRQQYAVVPMEASRRMIDSAARVDEDGYDAMLKAMIKNAPPPPEQVLSDEEIESIAREFYADGSCDDTLVRFAQTVQRAVLKQLGAKNVE